MFVGLDALFDPIYKDRIDRINLELDTRAKLDDLYNEDIPYVSVSFHTYNGCINTEITCSDSTIYKHFHVPYKLVIASRVYFLTGTDTATVIDENKYRGIAEISLLPTNKFKRDELILAQTMLPTSIWMLMCILGHDYNKLCEEVLIYED